MSLFWKLFKGASKPEAHQDIDGENARGKYMPDVDTPADDRFTRNFIHNGGKFLYCTSLDEIHQNFDSILLENDWYEQKAYCNDPNLIATFNGYNLDFGEHYDSKLFVTTCEGLIADNGSILICSNQIKEKKLSDFPENIVVYATTSQIISNIGDGLQVIKNKTAGRIPSNITTVRNCMNTTDEKDFMTYGNSTKNLYLLLLEDL